MRSRLVLVVGAGATLLLVAAGSLTLWRWTHQDTAFAQAVGLAPAGTERIGWTDWAAVRGANEPGSADELRSMLDAAYDADLSSASALATSAETLRDRFGVSPANLEWELFAQSPDGAALLLAAPRRTTPSTTWATGSSHSGSPARGRRRHLARRRRRRGAHRRHPHPAAAALGAAGRRGPRGHLRHARVRRDSGRRRRAATATGSRVSTASSTRRARPGPRSSTPGRTPASAWRWPRPTDPTRSRRPSWCGRRARSAR